MRKKLGAEQQTGTKHDFWHILYEGKYVGKVKDSHGEGEMRNHEIGGCARSLGASEFDFKALVGCTLSGEDLLLKLNSGDTSP